MIIIDGLKEIEYEKGTRVVIGKFDGIHAGHQKLIGEITGKNDDLKSVVFTFKPGKSRFLDAENRIFTEEERYRRFEELGVDYLVEFDLNEDAAKMEPEDFARVCLKQRLHAKEIVCGPDLSFGYKGRGNVSLLESLKDELQINIKVIEKVKYMGEDISSTRIKEALKAGNISDAEKMLRG